MKAPVLLVVDDSADNLFVLESVLNAGFSEGRVIAMTSALEGLARAAETVVDCAIIDIQMPGMDGIEMCRRLKMSPSTSSIPVILITSHVASSKLRALGLDAGARDFINRPVDNVELLARVNATLREKSAGDDLRQAAEQLDRRVHDEVRARRQTEELYRVLAEAAPDAIYLVDSHCRVEYANAHAMKLFGVDTVEVVTRPLHQLFGQESLALHLVHLEAVFKRGAARRFETKLHRGEGGLWLDVRLVSVGSEFGVIDSVMCVARDVTKQKQAEERAAKLEEQLFQSQKMEAIGLLAGGIAHDFNNLLSVILGCASELRHSSAIAKDDEEAVDLIEQAATRAAGLTRQILGFARKGKLERKRHDLHDVILEILFILGHSLDKRIELRQELAASPSIVMGDPGQLHQVLMNLAVNAGDAMPEGGVLSFTTSAVELDEESTSAFAGLTPGRFLRLAVSDTGTGLAPEIRERIFEPFFTTKPQGVGTGMGLATSYGIVRSHGGALWVEPTSDVGTTFVVLLPLSDGLAQDDAPIEQVEIRGSANILVVDDEVMVRNVMERMLIRTGYQVQCAGGAKAALELYRAHHDEIALVLLDIAMPGMGGRECLRELRVIDPCVRVIMTTGHSAEGIAHLLREEGATGFLQKPLDIERLTTAVDRALGKHTDS